MATSPRRQLNVRVPADLWEAVDARRITVGLSRDEWIRRVLTHALTLPASTPENASAQNGHHP